MVRASSSPFSARVKPISIEVSSVEPSDVITEPPVSVEASTTTPTPFTWKPVAPPTTASIEVLLVTVKSLDDVVVVDEVRLLPASNE